VDNIPVLNPTNTFILQYKTRNYKQEELQMSIVNESQVLVPALKKRILSRLEEMKGAMIGHFAINLPYNEAQYMLVPDSGLRETLQFAGASMQPQFMLYEYKIGDKVSIRLHCIDGPEMPCILFPAEVTINSEEFMDTIRPLYAVTKAWTDMSLAFNAVCNLVGSTKELNFFVPWLKYVFPNGGEDFLNLHNGAFHVARWLNTDKSDTHHTIMMEHRQVQEIIKDAHTNKRTWMPTELVKMVRTGEELITQFKLMKDKKLPERPYNDCVNISISIKFDKHPVIGWEIQSRLLKSKLEKEKQERNFDRWVKDERWD